MEDGRDHFHGGKNRDGKNRGSEPSRFREIKIFDFSRNRQHLFSPAKQSTPVPLLKKPCRQSKANPQAKRVTHFSRNKVRVRGKSIL